MASEAEIEFGVGENPKMVRFCSDYAHFVGIGKFFLEKIIKKFPDLDLDLQRPRSG